MKKPKVSPLSFFVGHDRQSMRGMMASYLEWMAVRNYTEQSVSSRAQTLHYFETWCAERGILKPNEVKRPIILRYQRWLFYYRKKNGQPLGISTQHTRLSVVSVFFRWLTRNNHLLYNPASELELPRKEKRLPRAILSTEEVEKVLAQADLRDPLEVRDRAIMEVLYSTGMRRMEVAGLSLYDIAHEQGTVTVRQGKGKKDRVIPIGERALRWVDKYVTEVRPQYVMEPDDGFLFLNNEGKQLGLGFLGDGVRSYVKAADIGKRGACHIFRHTMASLMLANGCDVRFIQEMLGHADLSSTQVYTQVNITKLKEMHTATHPAAKLARRGEPQDEDRADQADLLAQLDVEAEEEGTEGVR